MDGCRLSSKHVKSERDNMNNPSELFENELMEAIGMKRIKDFEIYDKYFEFPDGRPGHIHTIEAGFANQKKIVLIHGYGSGAVFYYQVIKELSSTFHVYSIDMYGFGSSARPPLANLEFEYCADLLTTALEEWRKKAKIEDFILIAHSLGGYISSQWVLRKNPPISMYYLLSPAGFTSKTKEELLNKDPGFFKTQIMNIFDHYIHDKKINPFNLLPFKEFFLKRKFKGARIKLPEKEADLAGKYLSSTLDKNECGEKLVGVFLRFAKYSHYPISETLRHIKNTRGLNYPVSVVYGEKDWMDIEHSRVKNAELGLHLEIYIVPNCDHQIILQNPIGFCQKVLADFHASQTGPVV